MQTETLGLRERKKKQTRERIAHVATLLFIERGFDEVTIAEIADAVPVSKMTITNYFPLKEDLVFDAHADLVEDLADSVRTRRPGESALDALRRGHADALDARLSTSGHCSPGFARLVHDSPRLRAHERAFDERREAALARALAEETGAAADDPLPSLAAAQFTAAHRVLHARMRSLIRAGLPDRAANQRLAGVAETAFALLEPALGDYCRRPAE